MLWLPHPDTVQTFRATGTGHMGDVTDLGSVCRFWLPGGGKFVLVWLKVHWLDEGSATGINPLAMKQYHVDRQRTAIAGALGDGIYDWNEVEPWPECGSDGDNAEIDLRVQPEEYARYTYQPGSQLVFEWTNPRIANLDMRWALEIALADATQR